MNNEATWIVSVAKQRTDSVLCLVQRTLWTGIIDMRAILRKCRSVLENAGNAGRGMTPMNISQRKQSRQDNSSIKANVK